MYAAAKGHEVMVDELLRAGCSAAEVHSAALLGAALCRLCACWL
jgi:hypothetical protein